VDLSEIECEQALRQIELYLDGELAGLERVDVERHIGGCSDCYGHSQFMSRLKEMLRDKCGCYDVPPGVAERVRALFAERDDPSVTA
jgi:mycothiol system anti-sigma-R factor